MSRGGRGRKGPIKQRTCVACRAVSAQTQLVRIVLGPSGEVRVGAAGVGRGAYLCPSEACLVKAPRLLSKAFRRSVPDPRGESQERLLSALRGAAAQSVLPAPAVD